MPQRSLICISKENAKQTYDASHSANLHSIYYEENITFNHDKSYLYYLIVIIFNHNKSYQYYIIVFIFNHNESY